MGIGFEINMTVPLLPFSFVLERGGSNIILPMVVQ